MIYAVVNSITKMGKIYLEKSEFDLKDSPVKVSFIRYSKALEISDPTTLDPPQLDIAQFVKLMSNLL
jgi:hypothetical protein